MFKKVLPYVFAVLIFLVALLLLRPAPSTKVVVAAADLRAGHVLTEADLTIKALPADLIPADAAQNLGQLVGQSLRIDRGQGDVIRLSHLGEIVALQPNERAIAVRVTDASGLAGLLLPGQKVGVVATLVQQTYDSQGSFSKATIEGLRVLYVDPRFAANETTTTQSVATPSGSSMVSSYNSADDRASEGAIVLAVPVDLLTIFYDFTATGGISDSRRVNALELLAALSASDNAEISLYLMPSENAVQFNSPGLWLPDLVITQVPTPTATSIP